MQTNTDRKSGTGALQEKTSRPPVGRDTAEAKAWGKLSSEFSSRWPRRHGFQRLSRDADSYTGVVKKYKESRMLLWAGIILGIIAFSLMMYCLHTAPVDMTAMEALIPGFCVAFFSALIILAASIGTIKYGCEDGLVEMVAAWNKAKEIIVRTETWKYLVDEIHMHYHDRQRCSELNAECAEMWRAEMSGICAQIYVCEQKQDMQGRLKFRGKLDSMFKAGRNLGFVADGEGFETFFKMATAQ
ncbi:MAG TPA: hypothetical protein VGE62_02235 [Candidatus Paceibacterota bacterium]